ncbi:MULTISPECIES: D-2-hydroxyacid dehydrogenase [Haloferax]|uniref:D-isomer specific 2-hydroxyacid dehydrogenase NAD-binding protein n=1 Tax=Haloferax denitrificans ATCC 35960 TaxID=662478 RepID=M0JFX9_9EURY|nr:MULTISPECIES: D-2-hydroxyacid dehydrogenase [Haloferax]EMA07997.1 D-isomer specific 2-hydroxyacid dehydrogenase NAD-binding protein [Haloferax denitrificans ATCC 35960]
MEVSSIAVDESVSTVFPPEVLRDALAETVDTAVVDAGIDSLEAYDAVVTMAYHESYLDDVNWIHSIQAGVDRFPFDELREHGVVLTNSSGIHGPAVGETVVGYMLSFARRLLPGVKSQTKREWSPPEWDEAYTLAGERCCIVGLGTLGRGVADRASALGLDIVGVRRSGEPLDGVQTVYTPDDLQTAIRDSKFVVLAVPLVDETHHLISTEEFAAMRDDAILINVARGPVVDQEALVDALDAGVLGGAALDVFEAEPLPEKSPLWESEDVLVTPHCAGFTEDYYRNVTDLVQKNLTQIDAGEELVNRVV